MKFYYFLLLLTFVFLNVVGKVVHDQIPTIESSTSTCMTYLAKNKYSEDGILCGRNSPHVFSKHIANSYNDCKQAQRYPYTTWSKSDWNKVWKVLKTQSMAGLEQIFNIKTIGH